MRKKFLATLIVSILALGVFVGCGNSEKASTDNSETTQQEEVNVDKEDKFVPSVKIEDIELVDFKVNKPDSIGTVYMECKFKNNSKETIKGISFQYDVDGEQVYLDTTNTLLPGDTSTLSDAFGPKSLKKEDAKLLKAEINVVDKDGNDSYIVYDAKLKTYSNY